MYCKAPFVGMTIDPRGSITLCCNSDNRQYYDVKISDVDDLYDFFNGENYNKVREIFLNEGFVKFPGCINCTKSFYSNTFGEYLTYNKYKMEVPLKLKFLEVTNSNICNQTCSTCGSFFSSKWRKIEKKLPEFARWKYEPYNLSDESVDKILKVLPDLETLMLKGGEPFADKNNLKFLNRLVETNPNCEVIIVSNFQHIPEHWWKPLSKLTNIRIGASVDGVGRTYDWIRSGNFENTVNNIKKYESKLGYKPSINVCISLYNIFNLGKISEYFSDYRVNLTNIVNTPYFLSPNLVQTPKLKSIVYSQYPGQPPEDILISPLFIPTEKVGSELELAKLQFMMHAKAMNKIRGFDIFELHPELVDIFN